ncbi:MAG: NmrA family transcriptional regulator, partial [Comamonadaceae bacterium]
MADAALGTPVNGMVEVGGPERAGMAAMVERYLRAMGDTRTVVADPAAPYFG